MSLLAKIQRNTYLDSLQLMRISAGIRKMPGVREAAVLMGTDANISMLREIGLFSGEMRSARPQDLLIVVEAADENAAKAAVEKGESALLGNEPRGERKAAGETWEFYSIEEAKKREPGANLAIISIPGKYAAREARKALRLGMNVMIFSDNVSLEDEIELKRTADKKGLIVMGPDCGTAIIAGTGLCFANKVKKGSVGIVGAAGTGIQELSVLIDRLGGGISQAIGTGGRDLRAEPGGASMMKGIELLENDPRTAIIVLLAKSADPEVSKKVLFKCRGLAKPVISLFFGGKSALQEHENVITAASIEQAASKAVELERFMETEGPKKPLKDLVAAARAAGQPFPVSDDLKTRALKKLAGLQKEQRHFRGLYCGGTLAYETASILIDIHELSTNFPFPSARTVVNPLAPTGNAIIDFGEDEFTRGRAHPMIDPYVRDKMVEKNIAERDVALVFLDVILGYGSHPDPCVDLARIIQGAGEKKIFLAHVCGTGSDIQGFSRQEAMLIDAGALTLESNAQMARTVGWIMAELDRRDGENG